MMNLKEQMLYDQAKDEARIMGNDYIGSEHILLALLHANQTRLAKELSAQGIYYFQVRDDIGILFGLRDKKNQGSQVTAVAASLFEQCNQRYAQKRDISYEECMGETLLDHPASVAMELLRRYNVAFDRLKEKRQSSGIAALDEITALHCMNFDPPRPFAQREEELAQLVEILLRKEKANPLLIGEAGVGKSALVEALAHKIQSNEIEALKGLYIYSLDINALVAGTRYRGDFEERIQKVIELFRDHPNAVLFIDELHQMIGAGKSEGSIDVAGVIKPCLARRELRCIGATTLDEYERYIEKDKALKRRFQCIWLKEPDWVQSVQIVNACRESYSQFHHVEIEESVIAFLVDQTEHALVPGHYPDKALDVLDLCCAHARANNCSVVSRQCVREVISAIAHIPLDMDERREKTLARLSEKHIRYNETRLAKELMLLKGHRPSFGMFRCWKLIGSLSVCREMLQTVSESFFDQKQLIMMDMNAYPFMLDDVLNELHRCPFSILCIVHLEDLMEELQSMLLHSLCCGELRWQDKKADLRQTLVVFVQDQTDNRSLADSLAENVFFVEKLQQDMMS
ncbi:MAG: AAA family ATPase [Merdibacter sp.]|nr:AAA family ATPase [Merdibacter sp.]